MALGRLLREPALHFVLLGAGLFALHRVAQRAPRAGTVVVPASVVETLRRDALRRTGHVPTEAELHTGVDRWVDDEVLFREALARGMEREDPVIRRRLVQSMSYALRNGAPVPEPTDDELAHWLQDHPAQYAIAGPVSVTQVFLARRRHGDSLQDDARRVQSALAAGGDPSTLGDPWVAPTVMSRLSELALRPLLGEDLTARALTQPVGEWSQPLESPLGMHFLKVTAREPAVMPPLADVRDRVRSDVLSARRADADARALRALRARYTVRWPHD